MPRKKLAETHPDVAKHWHPIKNGDLTPKDTTSGSARKVWWKCPVSDDHVWLGRVWQKCKHNGCPFCRGTRVSVTNRLSVKFPDLINQWHSKNDKSIGEFTYGSNKKVWWKCNFKHEWECVISNRTVNKQGCPYCSGRRASKKNRFDLHAREKLLEEWDYSKNSIKPKEYSIGSDKRVWWKCILGHEWESKISNRTTNKTNCPYCACKRVSDLNRFDLHSSKELLEEWDYDKNLKKPSEYGKKSNKFAWWVCKKDHKWRARIFTRTYGQPCPYCAKKLPSDINRLDLHTSKEILSEWSEKNDKSPDKYSIKSSRKVWWKCSKAGHEWKTAISDRTRPKGSNCPTCNESKGEKAVRSYLVEHKISYKPQAKLILGKRLRYDFYLPDCNTVIEYDGIQHFEFVTFFHKSQKEFNRRKDIDLAKTLFCMNNGIYIIRISYLHFDRIAEHMKRALSLRKEGNCLYFSGKEYSHKGNQLFNKI